MVSWGSQRVSSVEVIENTSGDLGRSGPNESEHWVSSVSQATMWEKSREWR
jgi:hypothetical protein